MLLKELLIPILALTGIAEALAKILDFRQQEGERKGEEKFPNLVRGWRLLLRPSNSSVLEGEEEEEEEEE
jgi:hypothetical protein